VEPRSNGRLAMIGSLTLFYHFRQSKNCNSWHCSGPFTVFAPNDEAFAKLPEGTVDALLKDIPKLKKILTYHVVSGKVLSAEVVKLNSSPTVEGTEVKIDASHGVKINDATVTTPDVAADNGVIHIIDTVLIPA
jgi:uncharacterized surface protein with fasciclin (FAS1) repeats